jgi:hypothetical protein
MNKMSILKYFSQLSKSGLFIWLKGRKHTSSPVGKITAEQVLKFTKVTLSAFLLLSVYATLH